MRIYVFGEDKDTCIELANRLNGSGIPAIIGPGTDIGSIVHKLGKEFDFAVFVAADDPIEVSVKANKDPKIKAAVCYNQKTMKSAMRAGVNLFVMDSDGVNAIDFTDAMADFGKPIEEPRRRDEQVRKQEARPQQARPQKKPGKKQTEEDEDDTEEEEYHSGEGGIKGKIKDIFGIE